MRAHIVRAVSRRVAVVVVSAVAVLLHVATALVVSGRPAAAATSTPASQAASVGAEVSIIGPAVLPTFQDQTFAYSYKLHFFTTGPNPADLTWSSPIGSGWTFEGASGGCSIPLTITASEVSCTSLHLPPNSASDDIIQATTSGCGIQGTSVTGGAQSPPGSLIVGFGSTSAGFAWGCQPGGGDAAPSAAPPIALSRSEAQLFSGRVAGFADSDATATAGDYTASIAWGDGSPTSTGAVTGPVGGPFTVSGTHTYADGGSFATMVTVTDADGGTVAVPGTATVAEAALTARGISFSTRLAVAHNVAILRDASPHASASDVSAAIDWGDGTAPTVGVVTATGGTFTVSGSHTYSHKGRYTVRTTLTDGSQTVTAVSAVHARGGRAH